MIGILVRREESGCRDTWGKRQGLIEAEIVRYSCTPRNNKDGGHLGRGKLGGGKEEFQKDHGAVDNRTSNC